MATRRSPDKHRQQAHQGELVSDHTSELGQVLLHRREIAGDEVVAVLTGGDVPPESLEGGRIAPAEGGTAGGGDREVEV